MWKSVFDNTALVLGIILSLHTLYTIIRTHLVQVRERRALAADLTLQLTMFFALTTFLAGKAQRFEELHSAGALPAFETLSDEALLDLDGVRARAEHLLAHPPHWDLVRLGAVLTQKQFAAFVRFLESYHLYWNRLELRLHEFKTSPRRDGALGRFLASASLIEDDKVREAFRAFEQTLGSAAARRTPGEQAP